jgi:hypothetical protein
VCTTRVVCIQFGDVAVCGTHTMLVLSFKSSDCVYTPVYRVVVLL